MTRVDSKEKQECCGCTACEMMCPRHAITMKPDTMGFLYPAISHELCVNCGLCVRVCNFREEFHRVTPLSYPATFAGRVHDAASLAKSQSGGMFAAISDIFLAEGGVVYGAGFEGHFRVAHQRACTPEERDALRKSKYVQSDMRGVFNKISDDLKSGVKVLFCGTACQVAGVQSVFGKKWEKQLYLLDIVCHGVPAPNVWRDYIAWSEKRYGGEVEEAIFRNKPEFGWKSCVESLKINGKWYHSRVYSFLFFECYMLRPSCHNCYFCNTLRPSDITIADMWGMPEEVSEMIADNKGCSYIQVNSEKGKILLSRCRSQLQMLEFPHGKYTQHNLHNPTAPSSLRDSFRQDYETKGFEYVVKKYGNVTWRRKIRIWLQKAGILPLFFRIKGKLRHECKRLMQWYSA